MRRISVLALFLALQLVPLSAGSQGQINALWFKSDANQEVWVKSLECNYRDSGKIHCLALIDNLSAEGVASLGLKWEQLDAEQKVLKNMWATADFAAKNPDGRRPNRELEGRGSVPLEHKMDSRPGLATVHLHFVFVELKNGTVIPAKEADSMLYKEVVAGRARIESQN